MGRIGLRARSPEVAVDEMDVVLGTDFSPTAFMFEEFISLGHTGIAVRSSAPEAGMLSEMPSLLRKFVRIVDDSDERLAVERLLDPVRKEAGVGVREDGSMEFPASMQSAERDLLRRVHGSILRLALGFNHRLQVGLQPEACLTDLRELRGKVRGGSSRTVLALIEGLLHCYEPIKFESARPRGDTPTEILQAFTRLVNDPSYVELSDSIQALATPEFRSVALTRIAVSGQSLASKPVFIKGLDHVIKIISVWAGVPLPDAGTLLALSSGRPLPILLDLTAARRAAIDMWKRSGPSVPFHSRSSRQPGLRILWLPPNDSAQPSNPDNRTHQLGTVKELIENLNSIQKPKPET